MNAYICGRKNLLLTPQVSSISLLLRTAGPPKTTCVYLHAFCSIYQNDKRPWGGSYLPTLGLLTSSIVLASSRFQFKSVMVSRGVYRVSVLRSLFQAMCTLQGWCTRSTVPVRNTTNEQLPVLPSPGKCSGDAITSQPILCPPTYIHKYTRIKAHTLLTGLPESAYKW